MSLTIFDQVFGPLYGMPCWNVKKGYASFLTLEFGQPHLEIREPVQDIRAKSAKVRRNLSVRRVYVHGEWHLWVYACKWRVLAENVPVGYSSSSTRRIEQAANELDGQALREVVVNTRTAKTVFKFDIGVQLETKPYDKASEQWLLYEPSGYVFVWRADGKYAHLPADQPDETHNWYSVATPGGLKVVDLKG
jgi:hypothetical protein